MPLGALAGGALAGGALAGGALAAVLTSPSGCSSGGTSQTCSRMTGRRGMQAARGAAGRPGVPAQAAVSPPQPHLLISEAGPDPGGRAAAAVTRSRWQRCVWVG